MGYRTRVTGEISIEPPLAWAEFKSSPFVDGDSLVGDLDVVLRVDEQSVDTEEGQVIRKRAVALVPSREEPYKAYHLVEHVQRAIDVFPGHSFAGHLECDGDDTGDLWRVVVRDGRATRVEPQLIWPDET